MTERTVTFAKDEALLLSGLLLEIRTRNEPAQSQPDREMLDLIEGLRIRLIDGHAAALDAGSEVIAVPLNEFETQLLDKVISDSGPMYGTNPNPVELRNLVILARARDRLREAG